MRHRTLQWDHQEHVGITALLAWREPQMISKRTTGVAAAMQGGIVMENPSSKKWFTIRNARMNRVRICLLPDGLYSITQM